MRLALYFFSLAGEGGGAERSLVRLAAEMHERGHDVRVVSWDPASARSYYPIPGGVRWERLGCHGPAAKLRRTARLIRSLQQDRPDLFVGFVMGGDRSIYFANLLLDIPIIAAERNAPDMYAMRLSRGKAGFFLGLFSLCRGISVQFAAYRNGYPARVHRRIAVIANAVDRAPAAADPGRASDRCTLLSVGRLSAQKGFDILIDAFRELAPRFPTWDLRIVGEGEERTALEERIHHHGLAGRVQLPGSTRDLHAEFLGAHLFVLPSHWEGFPNALAEAMAHGLPAAGFAEAPGVNQLIEDGKTGLLAAGAGDSGSLATSLGRLMGDAELRRRMGRNAAAAMQPHEPAVIYDRWESFLRRCAGSRHPDFHDLR